MNEKKHLIQINTPLYDEIKEYCDLNNLKINIFINELLKKQFLIEKYGMSPFSNFIKKTEIEKVPEEIQEVVSNHLEEAIFDNEVKLPEEKTYEPTHTTNDWPTVIEVPKELIHEFEENASKIIENFPVTKPKKIRRLK